MQRDKKKQKEITKHHIISKCKGKDYTVNHPLNIKRIIWARHQALHQLFSEHTPQGQLLEFYEIVKTTLSPEADALFLKLLSLDKESFYNDWLI